MHAPVMVHFIWSHGETLLCLHHDLSDPVQVPSRCGLYHRSEPVNSRRPVYNHVRYGLDGLAMHHFTLDGVHVMSVTEFAMTLREAYF